MLNRFCSVEEKSPSFDAPDGTVAADFSRLTGEQIERLIARRDAPTLWRLDPSPVHPPEPFGMIA